VGGSARTNSFVTSSQRGVSIATATAAAAAGIGDCDSGDALSKGIQALQCRALDVSTRVCSEVDARYTSRDVVERERPAHPVERAATNERLVIGHPVGEKGGELGHDSRGTSVGAVAAGKHCQRLGDAQSQVGFLRRQAGKQQLGNLSRKRS
jgi:hypothetical protein